MNIPPELILCLKKLYLLNGTEELDGIGYNMYWDCYSDTDAEDMKKIEMYLWDNGYIKTYKYIPTLGSELMEKYVYEDIYRISVSEKVMTL